MVFVCIFVCLFGGWVGYFWVNEIVLGGRKMAWVDMSERINR